MNKRELNVTELSNFAKQLDTISNYFDDSLNKIGSGFRNLTDDKIIEGRRSRVFEIVYGCMQKKKLEMNEKIKEFSDFIRKNIVTTEELDERHAKELEEAVASMGDVFRKINKKIEKQAVLQDKTTLG